MAYLLITPPAGNFSGLPANAAVNDAVNFTDVALVANGGSGTSYTCRRGAFLAVPAADAAALRAQGWDTNGQVGNGPTVNRPLQPAIGTQWHDDSLGIMITADTVGNINTRSQGTEGQLCWRNASGQIV